jgi:hypothetical protein
MTRAANAFTYATALLEQRQLVHAIINWLEKRFRKRDVA